MMIKILIVDDHAIFRDALIKLLNLEEEITIIGEARNGLHHVKKLSQLKPDILFFDPRMPDKSGLTVFEGLNSIRSGLGSSSSPPAPMTEMCFAPCVSVRKAWY
jgi:two-component system response regulator DesR